MNKKPYVLRLIIALVVVAIFSFSIYPLTQRDFYDTFQNLLKDPNSAEAAELIAEAKLMQAADATIYPSNALLEAANAKGIQLKNLVKGKDLQNNRDVISLIRKESSSSIRLGLDLNGGVEFMLELVPNQEFLSKFEGADSEQLQKRMQSEFNKFRDQAIETLRKRLEGQNIYEAEITPAGDSFIALRVPIVAKDEMLKLMDIIKMSARLRFHLVHPQNDELRSAYRSDPEHFQVPPEYILMESIEADKDGNPYKEVYFLKRRWEMDGRNIVEASASKDMYGQLSISLGFDSTGTKRFSEVTSENIGRQLAIVLDDKLYCAPMIRVAITDGQARITGDFSQEEAKNIADALVSGSMPFQINVDAVFITDPTLGKDNVANGIWAGILALVCTMLFVGVYYLRAGLVAVFALAVNMILVLGMMAAFSATLTLPGIAGIILTMGMAVDANVLIFERIREELNAGKNLGTAIDLGYQKAFSAVLDANLTTLFTALILMWVGTGPVKGFAITLTIGIVTSMFTALFLTRLVFDIIGRYFSFKTMKMCAFLSHPNFNFIGKRKIAFCISGVLIAGTLILAVVKNTSMFGVDFTGGTLITFNYQERVPQDDIVKALKSIGYDARVAYKESASVADNRSLEIMIRENEKIQQDLATSSPKEKIAECLNRTFPAAQFDGGQESSVGGLIGEEFSKSALIAIAMSFLVIIIYISFRYEFGYAIAGIVALIHDVIVATGIFLLVGREITLPVIAALLTIIGYSLNDTIVIFDRIREDRKLVTGKSFAEIVNQSINETLSRTILTSLTTLLVLIVLFFFGGIAINDFVLVMLLGVIIGTYSSIFISSSLVIGWHRPGRAEKSAEVKTGAREIAG
ncbi:protein translocase subunit SecD [Victivallis sp. Marseille-Q1083]|uniref:protein translocase subunit SecD n=1 Tax=Victivallis sp. Marseille-Q1083 TaxID=2717288 RepID=UPI0015896113|nr:protein translocase subunit SecD [Victivallis sp. Marseille-Q1083]